MVSFDSTKDQDDCSGYFVVFELIIANIPMLLFILAGYLNFRQVKGSGFNRIVTYSVFFRWKLAICVLAGVVNASIFVTGMIDPSVIDESGYYGACLKDLYPSAIRQETNEGAVRVFIAASRITGVIAWTISYKLLVYLYRKGLSEFWYAHKMFWSLNALFTLISTVWQAVAFRSTFMLACKIVLICLNVSLLALMFRTKVRTVEQPRPGLRVTSEGQIFEELDRGARRTTSYGHMRFQ